MAVRARVALSESQILAKYPRPIFCCHSRIKGALDRVIQGLPDGCAKQHFHARDGIAVFVVPIVTSNWRNLDDADSGIGPALSEPRFEKRIPKVVDRGLVLGDRGSAGEVEEA